MALLFGVFWVLVGVVVLKFNHASVITVGVLTGIMFLVFAAEEFPLAVVGQIAVEVVVGDVRNHPGRRRNDGADPSRKTSTGFADILGLVFLIIGIIWTVQAFTERLLNDVWWLGLISGILMV